VTTTTQAPAFGLPQLMRLLLLGTIVAPTTLLTSLLFYFGWSHAYRFYDYFGVNSTLLDLTTRDYLMRALDGLFVPMTVVALAGLVALWGHTALRARLAAGSRPRVLRILGPVMAIAGLALAIGGVSSVFTETALDDHLAAAPVSLAVGVLLPVYALHLRRFSAADQGRAGPPAGPGWAAVTEWAAVFVLVGLSLFWAAYRFRYDGLKLVPQSGKQYLFLSEAWTSTDGIAILMPGNDSLRLEFVPASAHGTVPRSTC
jgi:hypothetical protein